MADTQRTGAHGWPLAPSKHFPGELTLACPKCGSTDVVMGCVYGPSGRLGDSGGTDHIDCMTCGHNHIQPLKPLSGGSNG